MLTSFGDTSSEHLKHRAIEGGGEDVWIEVIRKMDEVYTELVQSQTELEAKNVSLEEAHAFIGSVLAAMTDVLVVCDADACIQQVNPALEAITGRSEGQLHGLGVAELFDVASRDVVSGFMHTIRAGGHISECEVSLNGADRNNALISVNCTPRRDHRGKLVGMVIVGRPVGELRRAYRALDAAHQKLTHTQQQLLVSEKMAALGRLVAGVAHELNNPISFVFGNMYALRRYGTAITSYLEACNSDCSREKLQALRKELKIDQVLRDIAPLVEGTLEGAERVRDIVQDLRRFSSNQKETPEQFNAVRLVHTAADWVIKAQRVKPCVRFDTPEKLEMVGLKGQLHQIIVNLVQNAADVLAGVPDPIIRISLHRDADTIVFQVADNGTGIRPDHVDKIFEPFFTTKPIGTGTGLGLYVSYNMAVKQGGSLTAVNLAESGAEFTLRMPAGDDHAQ
ncbi:MAG: PAS domain-containing protein [Rhodobiaceae bacterium]|nr:PAS domain-containing protein [Paracoccaceae bacterium]MCB1472733.1 PAS domain-containing protein [Rhodobiaceae bacterium]